MKRLSLILLSLLLYSTNVAKQNGDSLLVVWNDTTLPDDTRLQAIHKISWSLRKTNPDSGAILAGLGLNLAKTVNDSDAIARAFNGLAFMDYYRKDYEGAQEYFKKGIHISQLRGNKVAEGYCTYQLARTNRDQGNYQEAIDLYKRSIELKKNADDTVAIAGTHDQIGAIHRHLGELSEALDHFQIASNLYRAIRDTMYWARTMNNMGIIHKSYGSYAVAIQYFNQGLKLKQLVDDQEGIASSYLNLGNVSQDLENYSDAKTYFLKSLEVARKAKFVRGEARALTNLGIVNKNEGDLQKALNYYEHALEVWGQTSDALGRSNVLNSLCNLHGQLGNTETALDFCNAAYELSKDNQVKYGVVSSLINSGSIYTESEEYDKAIKKLEEGLSLAQEAGYVEEIIEASEDLYKCYKHSGLTVKALEMHELSIQMKDSLSLQEVRQTIMRQKFQKEIEKKALEDSLSYARMEDVKNLEIQEQQGRINKQRLTLLLALIGLFLIVGIAYSIYRSKKKSENLLLNILPEEIAEELKEKGRADARDFEMVSILFTDFKGFTAASEKLSGKDLVSEINSCFEAFDGIIGKYGIEKIKTIGDAYMAAGGLPVTNEDSIKNTVLAAIEMQAFISSRKAILDADGKPSFEMRVGVHAGPGVAGIVGVKKFQYDIWGDTVNTASRMESSGEVGKVNISEATYELLKNDPQFSFESRGKIEAKGKGEMEMYFVKAKV